MPETALGSRNGELAVIRLDDLDPAWITAKATEPGHLRWVITYVGGPEGYGNANPETGVTSDRLLLGMMRLYAGNRQYGLHTHDVTEIYVIISGQVESLEPGGIRHVAGPMDCIYIPAGCPHGVRAIGEEDVDLVWVHDGLEEPGVSVYFEESEIDTSVEYPRVSLVKWDDLEPQWVSEKAKEGGHMRWNVSWVGGGEGLVHLNPEVGVVSERVALGAMSMVRNNSQVSHSHPITEMYVIAKGRAKLVEHPEIPPLGPLDAVVMPPGEEHAVRAVGDEDLQLIWLHDHLLRTDGTLPD